MIPRPDIRALGPQTFDVIVIGGGINGASVARDAAQRGMSVCLVEKGDFASGTSSQSSKLAHGGMRYLAHGDFRLVHEACTERRRLLALSPHLVHPLPFLLPVYKGYQRGMLMLRAGMLLYDAMAAFRNVRSHDMLSAQRLLQLEPELEPRGLRGGALYYDAQMDDARLCVENILSAREAGATCLNYTVVRDLVRTGGRVVGVRVEDRETGVYAEVCGHVVVNTTGPWADDIRALDEPGCKPRVRATKGIHLIVPCFTHERAVVVASERDGRMYFVLPWNGYTMIGTTDTDHDGRTRPVYANAGDVEYLLTETKRLFPRAQLGPEDVIATFAGLRPLMNQQGVSESDVSREHDIFESDSGVVSMVGGKYTTYRSQAETLVDLLALRLYPRTFRPCATNSTPTYGGNVGRFESYLSEQSAAAARQYDVEPELVAGLIQRYGSQYRRVLRVIRRDPAYRRRLGAGGAYLRGEVVYQAETECARTVADVLRRRTRLQMTRGNGVDCADDVAALLGGVLEWDRERQAREAAGYRQEVARMNAWRSEFADRFGPGTATPSAAGSVPTVA